MQLLDITLPSPLAWHAWPFAALILLSLILRLVLPWSPIRGMRLAQEVLIILPAVLLYFLVRGLVASGRDIAIEHGQRVIELEQRLGIFIEPDLQQAIIQSKWQMDLANWIYIWAHWPVIALVVIWLVVRHVRRYPTYRNALLLSGMAGMVIFALFPVAPPRLMPGYDLVDTVTLHSNSYRVLQPPALTNPYAAMPSLHFGWNLLMGIALVREASKPALRVVGVLIPIAMFLAIVLTANHYIVDGLVGGMLVLISLAAASRLDQIDVRWPGLFQRRSPGFGAPLRNGPPAKKIPGKSAREPAALADPERFPLVIAHRFANSIPALERAVRTGVDVVEADVWWHRGRLEVRHEKTLGPIPVLWDRWSLAWGRRPRLELHQVLAALGPETRLMIDIKGRSPEAPQRIMQSLRAHHPGGHVYVCSQNWEQVDRFRNYSRVERVYSIGNVWQLRQARRRMLDSDWKAISIQLRLLDASLVRSLKAQVELLVTWPVNTRDRLQEVMAWGVDGFTSDNPELMAEVCSARIDQAGLRRADVGKTPEN